MMKREKQPWETQAEWDFRWGILLIVVWAVVAIIGFA